MKRQAVVVDFSWETRNLDIVWRYLNLPWFRMGIDINHRSQAVPTKEEHWKELEDMQKKGLIHIIRKSHARQE